MEGTEEAGVSVVGVAGTPSRTGGGGARVLVLRFRGQEGRTGDFGVGWRRRAEQVCSAHQTGRSGIRGSGNEFV